MIIGLGCHTDYNSQKLGLITTILSHANRNVIFTAQGIFGSAEFTHPFLQYRGKVLELNSFHQKPYN